MTVKYNEGLFGIFLKERSDIEHPFLNLVNPNIYFIIARVATRDDILQAFPSREKCKNCFRFSAHYSFAIDGNYYYFKSDECQNRQLYNSVERTIFTRHQVSANHSKHDGI